MNNTNYIQVINNEEQKVIFCDIDGTLLDDKKLISKKTEEKIQDIINNNPSYHFALASGRSLYEELIIYKKLGLKSSGLLVASNGAQIYSLKSHKIIFEKCIPSHIASAIINKLKEIAKVHPALSFLVSYSNSSVYVDNIREEVWNAYVIKEMKRHDIFSNEKVLIISVLNLDDNLKDFENFLSQWQLTVIPGPNFTAITAENVSKASAIEYVIKKYELKNTNIAVFGDSKNDVCMFEIPGVYSVTYADAKSYLKKLATKVIDLPKSEFISQGLIDFQEYIDQKNKKNNSK